MSDDSPIIHLSALTGEGVAALEQHLIELARPVESQGDIVLTNRRHYEAFNTANEHLLRVSDGRTQQFPGDLVAEDLRAVIDSLNSILGQSITSQDTLNNIFKNFCIGK